MAVVIGSGVDGLRAAAMLASTGAQVQLFQESETAHGLAHPSLPEGSGHVVVDGTFRGAAESVMGSLTSTPTPRRWIAKNGALQSLPMSRRSVAGLFEADERPDAGLRFLERRVRNNLIPLTGEGQEERTYREWVVRRMGDPLYRYAYASYAQRRWGLQGDMMSVAVARAFHNPRDQPEPLVPKQGAESALHHAVSVIEANGGEIITSANVRGFVVEDGRVVAVRVGRRRIGVGDQPVWVARTPSVIAGWLGESLSSGGHVDASCLQVHDRVRIVMQAGAAMEGEEVHLLDADVAPFRIVQPAEHPGCIAIDLTISPFEPDPAAEDVASVARRLGWTDADPTTARVERHHEWVPLWAPVIHPRLRRLSLAFRALGVVAVGRRGTFAPIGIGTELMLAARYAGDPDPDQREAMRVLLAPPVKDEDLDASFRDFIWR